MRRFCAGELDEDQTWSLWCVHTVDVLEMGFPACCQERMWVK